MTPTEIDTIEQHIHAGGRSIPGEEVLRLIAAYRAARAEAAQLATAWNTDRRILDQVRAVVGTDPDARARANLAALAVNGARVARTVIASAAGSTS
ncbi:hypothetical protein AB0C10_21490 [Microbispora amethystogenes]|uniref:hypothetical protein n=1 Tax=Microbispora amethystogenes TaxID=1427754 RepID=UPI0033FCC0A1